ncbi:macrophage migration inhibitory factor [Procambarus clarkii]|uniref:macrophage migration inhibitory factor n=1 Tax=Procambarus clarkii TaxID=6728 RepID=UPI001E6777A1|nr:macrophage migration inhibitory factor-like [Procambarus clarkii]
MPCLVISTNIPKERVTPEVMTSFSKQFSTVIGKPEQYCMVQVIPEQLMTFGGTFDPCASCTLVSLGQLGVAENKAIAKKIYEFTEKILGVPTDRMYIQFVDKPSSEIGYKGTTFHELLGR